MLKHSTGYDDDGDDDVNIRPSIAARMVTRMDIIKSFPPLKQKHPSYCTSGSGSR